MSPLSELEFVLLSNDYATTKAVSGGVKKHGAKFIPVPTAGTARDCLNRRKIDGVFVDLEVPRALEVIEGIRKGASNNKAVIFDAPFRIPSIPSSARGTSRSTKTPS